MRSRRPGFCAFASLRETQHWLSDSTFPVSTRGGGRSVFQRAKISVLAAMHETFGRALQFLPTRADDFRFGCVDVVVGGGVGNDGEEVGKFLDDFVRRGDEEVRMRVVELDRKSVV